MERAVITLGDKCIGLLVLLFIIGTWCLSTYSILYIYSIASLIQDHIVAKFEISLRTISLEPTFFWIVFSLLVGILIILWFVELHSPSQSSPRYSYSPSWVWFLVCVLMSLTLVATILAVGSSVTLRMMPHKEVGTFNHPCWVLDRCDSNAIREDHLVYLQYLDSEKEKQELKIINTIAGSWEKLGSLFGYDVNEIAKNYVSGMDHGYNCCRDVLTRWFKNRGARRYPLSWNGLIKAFKSIDMNHVADQINEALKCVVED